MARLVHSADPRFLEAVAELHPAPETEPDRGPSVDDELRECGVEDECIESVNLVVDRVARREAFRICAQVLHWIGEKLRGHNAHSASVAVALGLHGDAPLSEVGAFLGVSKQAMSKRIETIAPLFSKTAGGEREVSQREKIARVAVARTKGSTREEKRKERLAIIRKRRRWN